MAQLGKLEAQISAKVDGFQRDLEQAGKSLGEFGRTADTESKKAERAMKRAEIASKAMAAAAAVAATAVVAAGVAFIKMATDGLKAADEQAKLARRLGMTNEELATLQRASDFAGVSMGTLTTASRMLDTELGNAMAGSEVARRKFDELGLSVEELANMRADDRMKAIGQSIEGMGSHAEKTAAANSLFGRSGQEMMLLLGDATTTLERASNEVRAFGLALDEMDSTRIENVNDNISTLRSQAQGAALMIANAVAPALEGVTDRMVDWAMESDNTKKIIDAASKFIITGFGKVGDGIQNMVRWTMSLAAGWHRAKIAALEAIKGMDSGMFEFLQGIAVKSQQLRDIPILGHILGGGMAGALFREIFNQSDADGFVENIDRMVKGSTDALETLDKTISDMADAKPFSEVLAGWMADAQNQSGTAPRTAASIVFGDTQANLDDIEEIDKVLTEAEIKMMEGRFRNLQRFLMNESELETAAHQERLADLEQYKTNVGMTVQEYNTILEGLEQSHQDRLNEITEEGNKRRVDMYLNAGSMMASNLVSIYSGLGQAMNTEEEKLFEIQKNARTAQAVIDGISAAVSSFRVGASIGGPIMGGAFAAASIASTGAQIAAIRSSSYSGGGGSPPAMSTPSPQTQGPQGQMFVNIQGGDMFSGNQVRDLMDRIAEAQADGYRVVV